MMTIDSALCEDNSENNNVKAAGPCSEFSASSDHSIELHDGAYLQPSLSKRRRNGTLMQRGTPSPHIVENSGESVSNAISESHNTVTPERSNNMNEAQMSSSLYATSSLPNENNYTVTPECERTINRFDDTQIYNEMYQPSDQPPALPTSGRPIACRTNSGTIRLRSFHEGSQFNTMSSALSPAIQSASVYPSLYPNSTITDRMLQAHNAGTRSVSSSAYNVNGYMALPSLDRGRNYVSYRPRHLAKKNSFHLRGACIAVVVLSILLVFTGVTLGLVLHFSTAFNDLNQNSADTKGYSEETRRATMGDLIRLIKEMQNLTQQATEVEQSLVQAIFSAEVQAETTLKRLNITALVHDMETARFLSQGMNARVKNLNVTLNRKQMKIRRFDRWRKRVEKYLDSCDHKLVTMESNAIDTAVTLTKWQPEAPIEDTITVLSSTCGTKGGLTSRLESRQSTVYPGVKQFRCQCTGNADQTIHSRICEQHIWYCTRLPHINA